MKWKQRREILSLSKDGNQGQRKPLNRGETALSLKDEKHISICKRLGRQPDSRYYTQAKAQSIAYVGTAKGLVWL